MSDHTLIERLRSERESAGDDPYKEGRNDGLNAAITIVRRHIPSEISDYHRGFNDGLKGANKRDEAMKRESQEPALWEQKAKELLATNETLAQAYDALKREVVTHSEREKEMHRDLKRAEEKIQELMIKNHAWFHNEECWIWQGDGADNLESLVCPVVISAHQFRNLLSQIPTPIESPAFECKCGFKGVRNDLMSYEYHPGDERYEEGYRDVFLCPSCMEIHA